MGLDWFLSGKEILIDDAGWEDLILGVVIGAGNKSGEKKHSRRGFRKTKEVSERADVVGITCGFACVHKKGSVWSMHALGKHIS